jgi:hypothetical protein
MVGKEHVGETVWAAWPDSRQVLRLELADVTREEGRFDDLEQEWYGPGPWTARFGPTASVTTFGKTFSVGSRWCLVEDVFLTEAEARARVREHCLTQARALRETAEAWDRRAEEWK